MTKLSPVVPPNGRVTVYAIPGAQSSARALAVIAIDGNEAIDAWPTIRRLDTVSYHDGKEEQQKVWKAFRDWLNGLKDNQKQHGWDREPEFSMLHVFRWDHPNGRHRRLYGFKMQTRPGFEVCALCCYRSKDTHLTEKAVKRLIRDLSKDQKVRKAVRDAFKSEQGVTTWVH